ncbi:MAG: alkaline phosphatase [Flavobacteriaceae bacterium]
MGWQCELNSVTGKQKVVPKNIAIRFNADQHTGELISVFAKGGGAEYFKGIYENRVIYHKLIKALSLF